MAEVVIWRTLVTWVSKRILRWVPDRLLRWVWPQEELLAKIELFHFDSAPQFHVRSDRVTSELAGGGYNVLNWSPFKLTIVALDLKISIDAREIHKHKARLPLEILISPFSSSDFHYEWELTDKQARYVAEYPRDSVRVNVAGGMIVRTVYGELRKKFQTNVLVDIDRDR